MKALIIEDEHLAAQKLIRILNDINPDIEIIDVIETVEDAINWFSENAHPDIIFMDIQLNDGVCFEIFESVRIIKPIIFTTAYSEYAIQAFKVNGIDYLLKPIKTAELELALAKFNTIFSYKNEIREIENILQVLNKKYKERFFVKIGSRYKSILCNEINGFYIHERCTFLFTQNGQSIGLDFSLEQIEKLLNPNQFFRISRNFIVNINAIEDIINYSTNRLKLKIRKWEEPFDILVSRERVVSFKNWMDR